MLTLPDDTIERRWGAKIKARGIYRDPVRSSRSRDWSRQLILCLRWWIRRRTIVIVADSVAAVLELLARVQQLKEKALMITRLRLDADLYAAAPAPGKQGRKRWGARAKRARACQPWNKYWPIPRRNGKA